jgi:hypothetical protein
VEATLTFAPKQDCGNALEFNKRGLFIAGAAKSGTTLLISLLDNHPQLVVLPEETGYFEHRGDYLQLTSYRAKLQRLLQSLAAIEARKVCEESMAGVSADARNYEGFDWARFVALAEEFIRQPGMNDSLLLSEVIRAYGVVAGADCQNCVRWVEKTPRTESFQADLDELYPEAKLIQIVRDPRAVFASFKNRIMKRYGCHTKAHRLTRLWNRSAREIPRLRQNPGRYLVVRYEDLVRNSREILKKVCEWGGFEFSENLLEPTRAGRGWQGNSAFQQDFKGISAASADKWKDCLTEQEIWWIELHCRRGMELAGYTFRTDARFSLLRWLQRLPGESWFGYFRARRASICQGLGLLKDCQYA